MSLRRNFGPNLTIDTDWGPGSIPSQSQSRLVGKRQAPLCIVHFSFWTRCIIPVARLVWSALKYITHLIDRDYWDMVPIPSQERRDGGGVMVKALGGARGLAGTAGLGVGRRLRCWLLSSRTGDGTGVRCTGPGPPSPCGVATSQNGMQVRATGSFAFVSGDITSGQNSIHRVLNLWC
jgi:hypothetical protein